MDCPYCFRFYRSITNGVGQRFESTVEIINIRRAKTPERARQAAVKRFVRHQQLTRWDCLATSYEPTIPGDRQIAGRSATIGQCH